MFLLVDKTQSYGNINLIYPNVAESEFESIYIRLQNLNQLKNCYEDFQSNITYRFFTAAN
ncbi:hypothetical protein NBRC116595_11010 [Aliiglaciecola sp. NS0011-25]